MENYYELLNIPTNANNKTIKKAYVNKIKKYNNLKYLDIDSIKKIKSLKKAKYVLTNKHLKKIYNKIYKNFENKDNEIEIKKIIDKNYTNNLIANRIFDIPRI